MATCSVINLALNHMQEKGALKSTKIIDDSLFNTLNDRYTSVARNQFGVISEGKFFNVQTEEISRGGVLQIYSPNDTYIADFAVINKEFTNEFQDKFEDYYNNQALNESKNIVLEPIALTKNLQKMYDNVKEKLDLSDLDPLTKEYFMYDLNTSRTIEDFGELIKKLC